VLAALVAAAPPVHAAWVPNGIGICALPGNQVEPRIIADGAGGAIVVWEDSLGSDNNVRVQRLDADGFIQWTANGVPLTSGSYTRGKPRLVSDGAHGAIVVWEDNRSGGYDIYAQRISPSGAPLWAAGGVAICASAGDQLAPELVAGFRAT
jgi:hypothetical protein